MPGSLTHPKVICFIAMLLKALKECLTHTGAGSILCFFKKAQRVPD
ncbi:MAG: hypothetical protein JWP81_1073 [Ferruginibacter sp.]|nr:hypothetical protein [Ferruginibacter sp.]